MSNRKLMLEDPAAYYMQLGREQERERIIKLLAPFAKHDESCAQGCYPEDCSAPNYEHAIALIIGEQK